MVPNPGAHGGESRAFSRPWFVRAALGAALGLAGFLLWLWVIFISCCGGHL